MLIFQVIYKCVCMNFPENSAILKYDSMLIGT